MMEITQSNHTAAGRGGCSLTRKCALIMTEQGLTQYGITHQILWTALAEKVHVMFVGDGCSGCLIPPEEGLTISFANIFSVLAQKP